MNLGNQRKLYFTVFAHTLDYKDAKVTRIG